MVPFAFPFPFALSYEELALFRKLSKESLRSSTSHHFSYSAGVQ